MEHFFVSVTAQAESEQLQEGEKDLTHHLQRSVECKVGAEESEGEGFHSGEFRRDHEAGGREEAQGHHNSHSFCLTP